MADLVEQPVDALVPSSVWGLLDPRLRSETLGNEAAQVVRVIGRVGDQMAETIDVFDQATRLRALQGLTRPTGATVPFHLQRPGVMVNRIGRPSASTAA